MHDRGRPARIAMLTHGFHIGGGVPSVARWLSSSLRATGDYEVDVFDLATSSRDSNSRRLTRPSTWTRQTLHATCAEAQCRGHFGANAVEIEFMRYLPRAELTRTLASYDLVQVVCGSPAWAAPLRRIDTPVVVQAATTVAWERGSTRSTARPAVRAWRGAMTRCATKLENRGLRNADAVMVENHQMAAHVQRFRASHVHVAPPGVDTNMFRPHPDGPQSGHYLLSMCRLGDPRKGLQRMLHAYALMVKRHRDTPDLVLAGRGSLPPKMLMLIEKLSLTKRVHVRTDIPREELVDLYRGASIFLQTSFEEGLGISVLEAMACGVPAVATRTAGTCETIVDGVTGWLVNQDDERTLPSRFADRVLHTLATADHSMGRLARNHVVERFSTESALQRFVSVYATLMPREMT